MTLLHRCSGYMWLQLLPDESPHRHVSRVNSLGRRSMFGMLLIRCAMYRLILRVELIRTICDHEAAGAMQSATTLHVAVA